MNRPDYIVVAAAGLCPKCKGTPKPGRICCDACISRAVARQAQPGARERHHQQMRDWRRRKRAA